MQTKSLPQRLWQNWMKFGRWMGNMVGRVIMIGFYFVIAMPFSIGLQLGSDPLQMKDKPHWSLKKQPDNTLERARRLF